MEEMCDICNNIGNHYHRRQINKRIAFRQTEVIPE